MMDATPIVFLVDDDASVRSVMEVLIGRAGWQPETFATVQEYLARPRGLVPACLVIDAALLFLGGLALRERLRGARHLTPVIVTARTPDVSMAVCAMKAGVSEFLTPPIRDGELLIGVQRALERSRASLSRESAMQTLRDAYGSLSRREREVMRLVVSGRLNKQVGRELGISEITVKAHRGNAMRKMGADTLADLVKMAVRLRLTPWPSVFRAPPRWATALAPLGAVPS
jgi:FixJ family two-component response regulator